MNPRTPIIATVLLLAAVASSLAAPERASSGQVSLRPTHAALAARQSGGMKIEGEGIERVEPKSARPTTREGKQIKNIVGRSTILAHSGYWTMVPKGAVLRVPPRYRARVDAEPTGTFLLWQDFFQKNRGWLNAQPVKFSDAAGKTSLSEETLALHKALGQVVVAVFRGGPISCRQAPLDSISANDNSPNP